MCYDSPLLEATFASADRVFHRRVECNTGIIAASIPSMQPLLRLLFEKMTYSSSRPKKKSTYLRQESHSLSTFSSSHRQGSKNNAPSVTTRRFSLSDDTIDGEETARPASEESFLPLRKPAPTLELQRSHAHHCDYTRHGGTEADD